MENISQFRTGKAQSRAGGSTWVAEGAIVPTPKLVKHCPGTMVIDKFWQRSMSQLEGVFGAHNTGPQ
jgi:hypothetical protein